jgi:predicted site-specific integrase-resolvase
MASARTRGKIFGAPKEISKKNQQKAIICKQYFKKGKLTVNEICDRVEISSATYLRYQGLNGKLRPYRKETYVQSNINTKILP